MASSPTVAEIARIAGVGTATVDRVLNKRPGVNPETERRVLDAVQQLGGTPVRGRPRKTPDFRFAFVLPARRLPFHDLVDRQIAQLASEFRHGHITEITHRLDDEDPAVFAQGLTKLGDVDGIALLAPDVPAVKLAVNERVRAGVHVVTMFSDVAGSIRDRLISTDNRAAGRVAALLLGRMVAPAAKGGPVVLVSTSTRFSSEIDRRVGFAQVLEEQFAGLNLVRFQDLPEAADEAQAAFSAFLRDQLRTTGLPVAGVYNVGAATSGVAKALAANGLEKTCPLIAHDLTETHRALLLSGALAYVLHQDLHYLVDSAARVLRGLCEGVRGANLFVPPPIQILTAENAY